uniref:Uncharacterized protein n=1 Tax=Cucumis melo TaxID=3656 RepID=A0A9I9EDJ8_CUCME
MKKARTSTKGERKFVSLSVMCHTPSRNTFSLELRCGMKSTDIVLLITIHDPDKITKSHQEAVKNLIWTGHGQYQVSLFSEEFVMVSG